MSEPTYELQLKAADERRALGSSVRELRRCVFSPKNKELALLCGVLAVASVGGCVFFKLAVRR
jgi:hypothetical protein